MPECALNSCGLARRTDRPGRGDLPSARPAFGRAAPSALCHDPKLPHTMTPKRAWTTTRRRTNYTDPTRGGARRRRADDGRVADDAGGGAGGRRRGPGV